MADWSLPALTSTYTNFATEVKNRDIDLALQFDGTTSTSIPTGAIRWTSSANTWQKWTGSAWGALSNTFAFPAITTSGDQSIVAQHNGNAIAWYGRVLSKNATADKAAFLGTYGNNTGVFAHNHGLNAWADLYVNTTDGGNSSAGNVRLPSTVFLNGNQALHAGNYNSYSPTLTGTGASGTWGINVTGSAVNLSTTRNNWYTNGTISAVVGQLAWKCYGNSHTIFDASNGTSPDGGAVNTTNSAQPWSSTYPTLMGWNGANTYGVRVDSARRADSAASADSASAVAFANVTSKPTTIAGYGITDAPTTPAGAVDYFAMSAAPTGYLKANGAAISRSTYSALFAAIGTTFGNGDGSTTFNVPDLRGEFLRGWDDGRGVDGSRGLGSAQAATAFTDIVYQAANIQSVINQDATSAFSTPTGNNGANTGGYTRNGTYYYVRPRNIALLACIKF